MHKVECITSIAKIWFAREECVYYPPLPYDIQTVHYYTSVYLSRSAPTWYIYYKCLYLVQVCSPFTRTLYSDLRYSVHPITSSPYCIVASMYSWYLIVGS